MRWTVLLLAALLTGCRTHNVAVTFDPCSEEVSVTFSARPGVLSRQDRLSRGGLSLDYSRKDY